jgi:phage tail tube protein FII
MNRIIEGLKQAIRFAKGDKAAGKQDSIQVPQFTAAQLRKFKAGELPSIRHLRLAVDTEGK